MYKQWPFKILSTIGVLVQLLVLDIPRDLYRWLTLRTKDVRGQVIVITGAGSGLGQKMAEIFALERGAKIAIIDVNEKGSAETLERITSGGGKASFWKADISNAEEMNRTADAIHEHFGRVDIVLCNAALLYFTFFMELTNEQLRRAVDVNIIGTINTIRAFLVKMENENRGHIVTVSSIAGWAGETYGLAYCPSKFAVRGVMECLQMELRDRGLDGIKCTTVCPYFARTPMVLSQGMRPTSTWIPFMSVESCSRRIIDAVLKEKVVAFMPNYVHLVPFVKSFFGVASNKSLREYLNCRYEPTSVTNGNDSGRRLLPQMPDYFKSPPLFWWILIPTALAINFLAYYSPSTLDVPVLRLAADIGRNYRDFTIATNIFALVAHLGEGIYALILCERNRFSFACRIKWFAQTFLLGFSSLGLLRAYKPKQRSN